MPSFIGYCFTCNDYGHMVGECRKRSRNDNIGSHRNHAYGKDVFRSRYMHVPSPSYVNIVCHNYNIESLNVGRGTCSHMGTDKMALLYRKVKTEHMEGRDLHGTKGEMSLQE